MGLASDAVAQAFPSKPLLIVVPAAAGGNLDNVTRNIAQRLQEQLGQPVVVENRPGGNYNIAVDFVAKAPADGYTYLAIADSFLYSPAIVRTARFDPLKDFVGVSMYASVPQVLVVNPAVPAQSVKELIALAKKRPAELTYGSAGTGYSGHIAAELFSLQAGISMTHVPYKGNAPALVDVIGGRISMLFDTVSTSLPHIKSGAVRVLGVTTSARSQVLPDVPTVSEAGLPGYEAAIFNGLVARSGTPPAILKRLNEAVRNVVQQQELHSRFEAQGVDLVASESPEQFTNFLKAQSEKYVQVVRKANIRAD
ncbi:tripartite tricarboxylate transporter substrate binding protein [Azohydromonas australica]|uniref:tripartite tricarboxylate transporter substrate binding protein n=1 Tax=Azohydromonas australica TaxID=364039 RepID=UPI0006865C9B|nr:tripartite tricarboxylate transporter substrate binding protein [Azohydromonas australica]